MKKSKQNETEKTWEFNITISGCGKTVEEAWSHAVEQFSLDPGCTPDNKNCEVVED